MNQYFFGQWLDRAVGGSWTSHRRYLYFKPGTDPHSVELVTEFQVELVTPLVWAISWQGQTEGRMQVELAGKVLHRDIGYFTSEPTSSHLESIDEDTVVTTTTYGGVTYREEIRYLGDDLRLRQTVGRKDGELVLAGQYVERRT